MEIVYKPMIYPPQLTVKLVYFDEGFVIESVRSFSICFLLRASIIRYPAFLRSPKDDLLTVSSLEKRESL